MDLGLAVLDGFAPEGHALGHGHVAQVLLGHDALVGRMAGGGMEFGDGLGVAEGGGANLNTGHVKNGSGMKKCAMAAQKANRRGRIVAAMGRLVL
jgi:hypothetical protein